MTQPIDFYRRREPVAAPVPEQKMCCGRCGADVWTILAGGRVCCSDCDQTCPFHLNTHTRPTQ